MEGAEERANSPEGRAFDHISGKQANCSLLTHCGWEMLFAGTTGGSGNVNRL